MEGGVGGRHKREKINIYIYVIMTDSCCSLVAQMVKNQSATPGDLCSIPESGGSPR